MCNSVCSVIQSCLTPCDVMDTVQLAPLSVGILQARILEWVVMPSSRRSSHTRDRTQVSCIAGKFYTVCATEILQNVEFWINVELIHWLNFARIAFLVCPEPIRKSYCFILSVRSNVCLAISCIIIVFRQHTSLSYIYFQFVLIFPDGQHLRNVFQFSFFAPSNFPAVAISNWISPINIMPWSGNCTSTLWWW